MRRPANAPTRRRRGPWVRLALLLMLLPYGVPLLWILITSLKSNVEIFANQASVIFKPTLHAYQQIAASGSLGTAMVNSLIIAGGTTLLTTFLGVLTAYGLARYRSQLIWWILGFLILLQMVPQTAEIIPLYHIFAVTGLVNTRLSVVLADSALLLPFAILILRPFFRNIPIEIEEAAAIDGASRLRTFLSVVTPLALNGIVTEAALVFIIAWGEFLYAISLLSNPGDYPVSAVLSQEIGAYNVSWPGLMALAAVGSLPILIVFLMAQRRLASGLSLGAVK